MLRTRWSAGSKNIESGKHFDLVLLDIMMPNMNGWETLKTIRQNPILKNIPVIMLTAVNEDQKMISGLKIEPTTI